MCRDPGRLCGLVYPRSSLFKKVNLILANGVGVIDSGYRGEIKLPFIVPKGGDDSKTLIEPYTRLCQLMIMKLPNVQYIQVDELSDSERGPVGSDQQENNVLQIVQDRNTGKHLAVIGRNGAEYPLIEKGPMIILDAPGDERPYAYLLMLDQEIIDKGIMRESDIQYIKDNMEVKYMDPDGGIHEVN